MIVSRFKTVLFSVLVFTCVEARSSINPGAMNAQGKNQMVNLNLQFKSRNNKIEKSELLMPFYQTAELERKMGKQNVLIEINPRRGKNPNEVALDMRFYRAAGTKAFYKKEIIAIVNEESRISFKGLSMKVRPVLN